MYIPMLKNKQQEYSVLENMQPYFGEYVIPLIEIFQEKYENKFEKDSHTGEYIRTVKNGKKNKSKVKLPHKPEDIITLSSISEKMEGKPCFIDYYHKKKTPTPLMALLRKFPEYKQKILEITNYDNFIPVVSIINESDFSKNDIISLLTSLKATKTSYAFRIVVEKILDYAEVIHQFISDKDYLIVDIAESPISSIVQNLHDIQRLNFAGRKIIVNSTRNASYTTAPYEEDDFTSLIDCSLKNEYKKYGFDDFGDYCGMKDDLNTGGGRKGIHRGHALALFYCYKENKFYSIKNEEETGQPGYKEVISKIMSKESFLDSDKDCPVVAQIVRARQSGKDYTGWAIWNGFIMERVIHQQYKSFLQ